MQQKWKELKQLKIKTVTTREISPLIKGQKEEIKTSILKKEDQIAQPDKDKKDEIVSDLESENEEEESESENEKQEVQNIKEYMKPLRPRLKTKKQIWKICKKLDIEDRVILLSTTNWEFMV